MKKSKSTLQAKMWNITCEYRAKSVNIYRAQYLHRDKKCRLSWIILNAQGIQKVAHTWIVFQRNITSTNFQTFCLNRTLWFFHSETRVPKPYASLTFFQSPTFWIWSQFARWLLTRLKIDKGGFQVRWAHFPNKMPTMLPWGYRGMLRKNPICFQFWQNATKLNPWGFWAI